MLQSMQNERRDWENEKQEKKVDVEVKEMEEEFWATILKKKEIFIPFQDTSKRYSLMIISEIRHPAERLEYPYNIRDVRLSKPP